MTPRKIAMLAVLLSTFAVTGCASHMTNEEIAAYGTRTYPTKKEKLVEDVATVLKTMGYEIVVADAKKGIVKTARKEIGQAGRTSQIGGKNTASGRTYTTGYHRQYIVKISETKKGMLVKVTPKVFVGERDVSAEQVWNLDGAGGERELWASFFSELESMN
ncbi:MAG TPA: hypothetical protein VFB62_28095 [Polyangiaceae bacterium]|nr:hypothetical protein [Polyangiaceae bacterium]